MTEQPGIPAGDFSSWLHHARDALLNGTGTDVPCGECTACCRSSYFIHIGLDETKALERIPKKALAALPNQSKEHVFLGHDKTGTCPMLVESQCSIYEDRPKTCRSYYCRNFAAAGITAGDEKPRINERVARWRFNYPTGQDREEHEAVQAAAEFIQGNAKHFPGGKIPNDPNQLAVLAIKTYEVFLGKDEVDKDSRRETADAIVKKIREFDAKRHTL